MLRRSTITLLRIPFSFFLMPVFFFALSQVSDVNYVNTLLVFFILHFLVYPASNGYNSYMDKDEGSIGMLEKPPAATRQLFYLTAVLDIMALLLSFMVNMVFAACIAANICASRAYSYRGIRLKKYPVAGFLTVVVFQGAITYLMVYAGVMRGPLEQVPWTGMLISSLLFGGFYPLTQVYQHEQDMKDGVRTISYVLGVQGTFLFSGLMYVAAAALMWMYFSGMQKPEQFVVIQVLLLPVLVYFFYWWSKVRQDARNASFRYSLRMNLVGAVCTNLAFIVTYFNNHPN